MQSFQLEEASPGSLLMIVNGKRVFLLKFDDFLKPWTNDETERSLNFFSHFSEEKITIISFLVMPIYPSVTPHTKSFILSALSEIWDKQVVSKESKREKRENTIILKESCEKSSRGVVCCRCPEKDFIEPFQN